MWRTISLSNPQVHIHRAKSGCPSGVKRIVGEVCTHHHLMPKTRMEEQQWRLFRKRNIPTHDYAGQRNWCQILRIEECCVVSVISFTAVNQGFLDRNRYFSFKQLLSYHREAEWTRSRPTTCHKNWWHRESNPEPLGLQPGNQTTRPPRRLSAS
jgi:hypothetical protein